MILYICLACLATTFILFFVYFAASTGRSLSDFTRSLLAMSAIIMFGLFILLAIEINTPTAMDVYRGKTTLEITYKNNIPTDSTVVYK